MARFDSDYVPASAMGIFAHPDDAEFTVAGTLARWAAAGCEVTLVLLTSGNVGTHDVTLTREKLAEIREREERASAGKLGVKNIVFLGHDDCELQPTMAIRRELVREIRRFRPEVVLCNDPQSLFIEEHYVNHPDHRAAGTVAIDAVFPCVEMELLWPELGPVHKVHALYVSSTQAPNRWIDVTATLGLKIAALNEHRSQLGERDISDMIREWAIATAAAGRWDAEPGARPKYAEAFRVMKLFREEKAGGG
ncbi:MAG TPA: PIG-L deacetylase family protein [Candidatus Deferrimicrobiaceae bacterium]|jgi:LmbE family N-acetylglucosaminyl deacetylase